MGAYHDSNGKFRQTRTRKVELPLGSFTAAAVAVPIFVSESQPTCGYTVDNSEAMGIRWNNHGTPNPIFTTYVSPSDRKPGTDITVYIECSKSGATVGDAVKFVIGAFNNVVGALHDADATYGGDTDALVGDATAKTVSRLSRALASADIVDGATVTLSVGPKAALLGTDDVTIHSIYLSYEQIVSYDN